MRLLIKKGRVIDPSQDRDEILDILIEGKKISQVKGNIIDEKAEVIDARGYIVTPGFIDMHTHLREPGREDEETIYSGTRAGANGGFTALCCMPNTSPCIDNQSLVKLILEKARYEGVIKVYPIGAITKGREGKELAEVEEMKKAGVVALSDDGNSVNNTLLMRRALEYARMFDLPVISHCEDKNLSERGIMNEGYVSTVLGFQGIPKEAEEITVARDLMLAELTGAKIHIAHISTARAVGLVREAKKRGVKVTCEVTPHHFTLTDEAVKTFDTNTKVNPPLRTREDVECLLEGLKGGTIDCIATDHAPHTLTEKELEYNYAPFGIVGLETALGLVITELIGKKILSWKEAIQKLTWNPARILGLKEGTLREGSLADITIINPDKEWQVRPEEFLSQGRNTPFQGWKLKGEAIMTIVEGKIVKDKRGKPTTSGF